MLDPDHSPPPRERKVSTKVKKPPPLRKRHTKPCKFFQFGRCSNTAEDCNFAHVLVVPALSLSSPLAVHPAVGVGGVCKFYAVGRCPSEAVCGMHHVHDINALGTQMSQMHIGSPPHPPSVPTPYSGSFVYPSPYTSYPSYYPPWSPGSYCDHSNTGPGPIVGGGYPPSNQHPKALEAESPSVSISASTDSSAISRLDTPGDGGPIGALGLSGVANLNNSGINEGLPMNANPAPGYDDVDVITEDPQFSEHAHNQHQSRIRVVDVEHGSVPPGYGYHEHSGGYPIPLPPPWDAGGMHYYSQSSGFGTGDHKVSITRSSSRASSRSRTAKYKTKPCKYFSIENGCPNGDNCTFMHDPSIPPVPPLIQNDSRSPTSPEGAVDRAVCLPRKIIQDNGNLENGVLQSEDVVSEDNKDRKKNFFPITWRVIGGGVLMGGKRTESSGEICECGAQEVGRSNLIENTAESRGNGVGDVATGKRGFLKFGMTRAALRPRSQSTSSTTRPRTGSSGKGSNDNLFSAESP